MNNSVDSELPVGQYADEARPYIRLLHKSFAIQTKKLGAAYAEGIITETEYDQWFEFFDTSRKEWLAKDVTKPKSIHFLALMAKHNMEIAKKLTFTRLPYKGQ